MVTSCNKPFSKSTPDKVPLVNNVGIVIPTFNEEKNIGSVLSEIRCLGYKKILVIDGSSKDETVKIATEKGAIIVLQEGHGKGQAIRQVLNGGYLSVDFLILLDADGSMSPQEIPRFLEALNRGGDVIKGSRFISSGYTYDMTAIRKLGNLMMTSCFNILYSTNFTDLCYGYVALNKKAIEKLAPILKSNYFEIEAEIFVKAVELGLKIVEVPSIEYSRKNGTSNLHSLRDGLKIFKTILNPFFRLYSDY